VDFELDNQKRLVKTQNNEHCYCCAKSTEDTLVKRAFGKAST